jgi:hypothetical protein
MQNKFKAGDRVVRTGCSDGVFGMFKGSTYTVKYVHSNGWIELENLPLPYGTWNPAYFELAANRHKHADLIIAWANGAKIQSSGKLTPDVWHDIDSPTWWDGINYRVKPEKLHPFDETKIAGLPVRKYLMQIMTHSQLEQLESSLKSFYKSE